jgi:hypothetical protein
MNRPEPTSVTPATLATMTALRQSIAEAGLTLADETSTNPRGGVRLTPIQPAPVEAPTAVRVSWSVHHRLYTDLRRGREALDVLDLMNLALGGVLTALGWDVLSGAPGQPAVVVGQRAPGPPARGEVRHG